MASPRPRDDASFADLAHAPLAEECEGRLVRREEIVALRLADLETRLASLEADGERALASAATERAALAQDLERLERELACLRSARSAVATLRPAAARPHLASLKTLPPVTLGSAATKGTGRRGIT